MSQINGNDFLIQERLKPQIFTSCQKEVKEYESIGQFILTSLDRHKNVELFIDCESDRRWTGHTMGQFVRRIATWLIDDLHMEPGQITCVSYDHSDITVALALAILCAGGVVSSIDPNDPYPEILYQAQRTHPSFLFCHNNRAYLADQLRNDLSKITKCDSYNLKFAAPDGIEIKKFLLDDDNDEDKFNKLPVKPHGNCDEMLAVMSSSSGTTGVPKIITVNHRNCFETAQGPLFRYDDIVKSDNDDADNRHMKQVIISCLSPFHYASGRMIILRALESGYKIALIRNGNIDTLIEYIKKYTINFVNLGAGTFQSLVSACVTRTPSPKLDCILSTLAMGGHLASLDQVREFFQLYPNIRYCNQGYGASEIGAIAFTHCQSVDKFIENPNNCGQLCPNYHLKIVDINVDNEKLLGADQRGMFHVGGPNIFRGYYDIGQVPEPPHLIRTNGEVFDSDGFYITGDIGWIDSRTGDVYFEGRLKELMCCRGCKKVFPQELENLIVQNDQVAECVVLGIKSDSVDCPRAFIVPSNVSLYDQIYQPFYDDDQIDSSTQTNGYNQITPSKEIYELAKNVLEFAHANIAWEKQLTGGICVLRNIPRMSTSGKINKRYLRSLTHNTAFIYSI